MQAFCNNKLTFYYQYSGANFFLSVLKLLVGHLFLSTCNVRNTFFQTLKLDLTRDSNKNCIMVIRDIILIIVRKSYNDLYTNITAIQRNKV